MSYKPLDSRQISNRAILQELFPWVGSQTLDVLLSSINSDLTPPYNVDAQNPVSLTVNVGASIVSNPESNRNHSSPFIGTTIPSFSGGTVTFPSSSGGNITTSTGGSTPLTLSPGNYCAVLISIDTSGNLGTSVGTQAGSPSAAVVPAPEANTLPIAYVIVHNNAGTIANIAQDTIYQLPSGSGGGGNGTGGAAQEVSLSSGSTSITVTYGSPRSDTTYGIVCQLVNITDATPQFQPVTITSKTTTGFTATWDAPLDTSHYALDYIIGPGVSLQVGEFAVSSGSTSATISFPINFTDTNYVVIAELADYTDLYPQFQPITVTNKTISQFTVTWNSPLNTNNYRISWQIGSYQ